jgi:hypothetical protein
MDQDEELGGPLPLTWLDFAIIPVSLIRGLGQTVSSAFGPLENSMIRASTYKSLRKVQKDSFRAEAGQAIEALSRGEK